MAPAEAANEFGRNSSRPVMQILPRISDLRGRMVDGKESRITRQIARISRGEHCRPIERCYILPNLFVAQNATFKGTRVSKKEIEDIGFFLRLVRSEEPTPHHVTSESHCLCLLRLGHWGKESVDQ